MTYLPLPPSPSLTPPHLSFTPLTPVAPPFLPSLTLSHRMVGTQTHSITYSSFTAHHPSLLPPNPSLAPSLPLPCSPHHSLAPSLPLDTSLPCTTEVVGPSITYPLPLPHSPFSSLSSHPNSLAPPEMVGT